MDEPDEEVDEIEKSPLPAITAAASWMDNLKLPMREIKKKYTKSELIVMAWDSRLKSHNMRKMRKPMKEDSKSIYVSDTSGSNPNGIKETADSYVMPSNINKGIPLPKKWINPETQELDLRQATGQQAVAYLNALGFNIATKA